MALGETVVNPNEGVETDFQKDDYTKNLPPDYSFEGVRFFPAFFAWVNCLVFFALMLALTAHVGWAFALSCLYIFDNALIVHSRGAMLDSIQYFGILVALLAFFKVYQNRFYKRWMCALAFGVAWATWTKLNGLVVAVLFPFMIFLPFGVALKERIRKLIPLWGLGALVFSVWTVFVWQTHFSLGKNHDLRLQNSGWYKASEELKDIKNNPAFHTNIVENFYVELRDYFQYMNQYAAGVPRLDLCKIGENGSPFFWWPLGAKTINYRWETTDDSHVSYLILVSNPVGWAIGLIAIILTFSFLVTKPFSVTNLFSKMDVLHIWVLFSIYLAYMISMANIGRVMYLYHYFIPLLLSFCLAAKWIPPLVARYSTRLESDVDSIAQSVLILSLACGWYFMSPLTYYHPLTCTEFNRRAILDLWKMYPVNCKQPQVIQVPSSSSR